MPTPSDFERNIDDVVATFLYEKQHKKPLTLLIGAGCSVSAGIPAAPGVIKHIEEHYKHAYQRVIRSVGTEQPTYNECMSGLSTAERRAMIEGFVQRAQINWAHIAIACLMKAGYVDRVLTFNFDNLLVRACALLDLFPAVYDMTAQRVPIAFGDLPKHSIFYLHGQSSGFRLMNTDEELAKHAPVLGPCFNFHDGGRAWVVAGYSGGTDPIFKKYIEGVHAFTHGLYWIHRQNNSVNQLVRESLFSSNKEAYSVATQDADIFFCELARRLDCFPPEFVAGPFTYFDNLLSNLTPYPLENNDVSLYVPFATHRMVKRAIEEIEDDDDLLKASSLLMSKEYVKVIELWESSSNAAKPALIEVVSRAWLMQGNVISKQATQKTGPEAVELFAAAGEKYAAALAIKPDFHEAHNNWGLALSNQALQKSGSEADLLFDEAGEKYAAALAIKPDYHTALNSWGNALSNQARQKSGPEADALFLEAGEKYAAALAIKPDKHEALYGWGIVLWYQAKQKSGSEADALFVEADAKYAAALAIKPDYHDALYGWGIALSDQAKQKSGSDADALFVEAGEKYAAALAIKPDKHEALNSWGIVLSDQAKNKSGFEADALFAAADEKYAAALAIKPDYHEALNNWGVALTYRTRLQRGNAFDEILNEAATKLNLAESISPGNSSYNLACVSALQEDSDGCHSWLNKAFEYGVLPNRSHLETDSDLDSVRTEPWFVEILAKVKQ